MNPLLLDNLALAMLEKELEGNVESLAKATGWKRYHTHDSRRSPEGFPDDVLVRGKRLIFAECKRQMEDPKPKQQEWLDALEATGLVEVYVWRPSDWLSGTIERIMKR